MSADDLVEYENLKIITIEEIVDLIETADTSFRFLLFGISCSQGVGLAA